MGMFSGPFLRAKFFGVKFLGVKIVLKGSNFRGSNFLWLTVQNTEHNRPFETVILKLIITGHGRAASESDHKTEKHLCPGVNPDVDLFQFREIRFEVEFYAFHRAGKRDAANYENDHHHERESWSYVNWFACWLGASAKRFSKALIRIKLLSFEGISFTGFRDFIFFLGFLWPFIVYKVFIWFSGFLWVSWGFLFLMCFQGLLTLAGTSFFAPLRGYRPQKWSPGKSSLLNDWSVTELPVIAQKNQKRFDYPMDISKCPQNVLSF